MGAENGFALGLDRIIHKPIDLYLFGRHSAMKRLSSCLNVSLRLLPWFSHMLESIGAPMKSFVIGATLAHILSTTFQVNDFGEIKNIIPLKHFDVLLNAFESLTLQRNY